MASISFNSFERGLDLRKNKAKGEANRLLQLKNAFITSSGAIQKREGIKIIQRPFENYPYQAIMQDKYGNLIGFFNRSTLLINGIRFYPLTANISSVESITNFNGNVFIGYQNSNSYRLDYFSDPNTPNFVTGIGKKIVRLRGRMFMISSDVVKYSAANNPLDWTTVDDAGFLPTNNNTEEWLPEALGVYDNKLAVFYKNSVQLWNIEENIKQSSIDRVIRGVGTLSPHSIVSVLNDIYFLSGIGIRSISKAQYLDIDNANDIGAPIDSIINEGGQNYNNVYWRQYVSSTLFDSKYIIVTENQARDNRAYVLSINEGSGIKAWSEYESTTLLSNGHKRFFTEHNNELYFLCYVANPNYPDNTRGIAKFDKTVFTDDDSLFEVMVQTYYLDFKSPGVLKNVYGMDVIIEGEGTVSIGWDVNDDNAWTEPMVVSGNTRPYGMIPLGINGTEFSIRIRNYNDQPFKIENITLYYHELGIL